MLVTVTNLTTHVLSTDVGSIAPSSSRSLQMGPVQLYKAAQGLKVLEDAGKVRVVVSGESSLTDSMESAPLKDVEDKVGARLFLIDAPDAKTAADGVHAAVLATAAKTFPGPITDPVYPRNVIATFEGAWDGGNIVLGGTDQFDQPATETLLSNAGSTRVGAQMFKTITHITHSVVGKAAKTVTLGTGDTLSLPNKVANAFNVLHVDDVVEAGVVNATYHSVAPTTVPNGAHVYKVLANLL